MPASGRATTPPSKSRTLARGAHSKIAVRKSAKGQRILEQRAQWIMREWERTPTLAYHEAIDLLRERFECGIGAAEDAYAKANELWAAAAMEIDPNRLLAYYWKLAEHALSDERKARGAIAAARIIDSIFEKTGLAAPSKIEHSFADVQRMSHLGVLGMTPTQRRQRENELIALAAERRLAAAQQLEDAPSGNRIIDVAVERVSVMDVVEAEFSRPLDPDPEEDPEP